MERVIIKPCLFFRFNGGYGDEIAITILQDSARGIGLSKRQSIWEGGIHPADLDGHIGPPDPRAGTPWCFAYGETEWVAGKKFDKIKKDAMGTAIKAPIARLNCTTGESF